MFNHRLYRGLTTIEVIVVAVLVAIAFTFVASATDRTADVSDDRRAQGNASAALDAQVAVYRRDGVFTERPELLADINPNVNTTAAASQTSSQVAVAAVPDQQDPDDVRDQAVGVAVRSDSGACWYGALSVAGGSRSVSYGTSGDDPEDTSSLDCTGDVALLLLTETAADPLTGNTWTNATDLDDIELS